MDFKNFLAHPHDLIALGHYPALIRNVMDNEGKNDRVSIPSEQLSERLPILMRLLSLLQQRYLPQNQPKLSQTSVLVSKELPNKKEENDKCNNNVCNELNRIRAPSANIEEIYSMLEDVAASIPEAEEVEDPVSLAPSVCKAKLGRSAGVILRKRRRCCSNFKMVDEVRPSSANSSSSALSKSTESNGLITTELWITSPLVASLKNTPGEKSKNSNDIDLDGMEDENEDEETEGNETSKFQRLGSLKKAREKRRNSIAEIVEDSQEVTMGLVLSEIIELIVKYLDQQNIVSNNVVATNLELARLGHKILDNNTSSTYYKQDHIPTIGKSAAPCIQITTKSDSVISSTESDNLSELLSTIIPVLMYHAPVLRHQHIANVLCRSAIPRAAEIILHLAINCPAASSSLARGCIDAYFDSIIGSSKAEAAVQKLIILESTAAMKAIAGLSPRECANIKRLLLDSRAMPDIFIILSINSDKLAAATAILDALTNYYMSATKSITLSDDPVIISNHRMDPDPTPLGNEQISMPKDTSEPWIVEILTQNRDFALKSVLFVSNYVIQLSQSKFQSFGECLVVLRCYSIIIGHTHNLIPSTEAIESVLNSIVLFFQEFEGKDSNLSDSRALSLIKIHRLSFCICIMTITFYEELFLDPKQKEQVPRASDSITKCYQLLVRTRILSRRDEYINQLASYVRLGDVQSIQCFLNAELLICESLLLQKVKRLKYFCVWAKQFHLAPHFDVRNTETVRSIAADPLPFISSARNFEIPFNTITTAMEFILKDSEMCCQIFEKERVSSLISISICALLNQGPPYLPCILPLQLYSICNSLCWNIQKSPKKHDNSNNYTSKRSRCRQAILHFIYTLSFLKALPDSPFSVQPRLLPLREALHFCERDIEVNGLQECHDRLLELIHEFSPESAASLSHSWNYSLISAASSNNGNNSHGTVDFVSTYIAQSQHEIEFDPSGVLSESLYINGMSTQNFQKLQTAVAHALLVLPNSPRSCFTFESLCRDPLVLLKSCLRVWRSDGLRRIMLSVLEGLLEANTLIVYDSSPSEDTASEMLAIRDLLIVRTIINGLSGKYMFEPGVVLPQEGADRAFFCNMAVGLVRSIVSRRQGLIASLFKQGISELSADILIFYVPEASTDIKALCLCLDTESLLAADRLRIADASLKLAVSRLKSEDNLQEEALTLIQSSLLVLMRSQSLIFGPEGVAVNVLRCEDDGQSITLRCRKLTMRMFSTLLDAASQTDMLGNVAGNIIASIAATCKAEGIVPGVTSHRKKIIKEVWDAAMKVLIAMRINLD